MTCSTSLFCSLGAPLSCVSAAMLSDRTRVFLFIPVWRVGILKETEKQNGRTSAGWSAQFSRLPVGNVSWK